MVQRGAGGGEADQQIAVPVERDLGLPDAERLHTAGPDLEDGLSNIPRREDGRQREAGIVPAFVLDDQGRPARDPVGVGDRIDKSPSEGRLAQDRDIA